MPLDFCWSGRVDCFRIFEFLIIIKFYQIPTFHWDCNTNINPLGSPSFIPYNTHTFINQLLVPS